MKPEKAICTSFSRLNAIWDLDWVATVRVGLAFLLDLKDGKKLHSCVVVVCALAVRPACLKF